MPKGESTGASVEHDILTKPQLVSLTDAQKIGYLGYWLTAVRERREYLPPPHGDPREVSRRHFLKLKSVRGAFDLCLTTTPTPLLWVSESKVVRVCGAKAKHAYLKNWHNDDDAFLSGEFGGNSPQSGASKGASCRTVSNRTASDAHSGVRLKPLDPQITIEWERATGKELTPLQMAMLSFYVTRFPADTDAGMDVWRRGIAALEGIKQPKSSDLLKMMVKIAGHTKE